MAFEEKSALGLLAGLVLVSAVYFPAAFRTVAEAPHPAPLIALLIAGVVVLVIVEVIYHAIIAATSRRAEADERDVFINLKAERNGSLVLGIALFWLIGHILASGFVETSAELAPLTIAVLLQLAITVAEVAKLSSQLWYYRVGT